MAPYNPPHRVKTVETPYRVLVMRHDPNFEAGKRKEPFYEFTGRDFYANTAVQGAYSSLPNDNP
jgi:hypothetical protein